MTAPAATPRIALVTCAEVADLDDGSPYPIITGRYDEAQAGWESTPLAPSGTPLAPPTPIFPKLDPSIVDEELRRLEEGQ